ncbi:MAG: DUF4389 domain-containing protein [Gammaproteobacteria bacterium]|nr:DUF4389 domain-containing protein [Gammaproteobacteria bacterium]
MSDELDEIVDNLREPTSWFRIVFMIAFAVVLYLIIAPIILVIMITQVLFRFITGAPNSNLRDFSGALAAYIFQILKFLLYSSEDKPFPFSDFPSLDDDNTQGSSKPTKKKSAGKKAPAKKASKKKAAKKSTLDTSPNGSGEEKEA